MDKQDKPSQTNPEREGLGPSPTVETEATSEDVGAGSKPARPRLAEVLGVEEDEEWEAYSAVHRIHRGKREIKRGQDWVQGDNEAFLAVLINNPSQIKRLPRPRLTEPEIAIMRAMGAKWVSFDTNSIDESVMLWSDKPDKDGNGIFSSPISFAIRLP